MLIPSPFGGLIVPRVRKGPPEVAFRAASYSTGVSLTAPAEIQAGDLLVFAQASLNISGIPSSVTPSGFTTIVDVTDGDSRRAMLSWRLANGTEASTSLTGMSALNNRKGLAVFSGEIEGVDPRSFAGETTGGAPENQIITSSGGVVPTLVLAAYLSTGSIDPRGMSPAKDGEDGGNSNSTWFAWKIYNDSPANVTVSMDDEGSNALMAGYFNLS